MMKNSNGKQWPYMIALSTIAIIIAAVITVIIAVEKPVQLSNYSMQQYHVYDRNANEFIQKEIAFNKRYTIEIATSDLSLKNSTVSYKLTDKESNAVSGAKLTLLVSHPFELKFDKEYTDVTYDNGLYTFDTITLEKEGRWNLMLHVEVDGYSRFYNLKADTRNPNTFEI